MNNGKVRIYELSKELNLENKDILAVCERLNISVKSHSSTITESDAERIRKTAENLSHSPEKSAANEKSNFQSRASSSSSGERKKQEIIEIRKPNVQDEISQETDIHQGKNSNIPLVANPRKPAVLPNQIQSTAKLKLNPPPKLDSQQEESKKKEAEEGSDNVIPPAQNQIASSNKDTLITEISEERIETQKPKLVGPPVRLTDPASKPSTPQPSLNNRSGQKSKKKQEGKRRKDKDKEDKSLSKLPQKDLSEISSEKPVPSAPETTNVAKPKDKPRKDKPTVKPKAVPELQRPQPIRPSISPAVKEDRELATDDIETTVGVESELGTEVAEIEKPRRKGELLNKPNLLRAPKKGSKWEEEEEDPAEANSKTAKAGTKVKRHRPKPLIDDFDEEELEDEDLLEMPAPAIVSLSLARPPKPKSQAPKIKPTPNAPSISTADKSKKPSPSRDSAKDGNRGLSTIPENQRPEKLVLAEAMTVQELAATLMVPETEIIKGLFMKGVAVNITETLALPTIQIVAEELGVEVETLAKESAAKKTTEMLEDADLENLQRRPPVVTIMGHVDHGKTTLLDSIRSTTVAQGEAGGITQHIGAYHVDVEHGGRSQQVVFLDTPGHEAFTAMRARGARVTDIAILVVAADDGVRPQTIEAISHAKAAQVPIVVAINKIDKEEANPNRVKQELMEYGLVWEDWGGDTIMVPVSAIKGENLDELLEMILLVAEIEDLQANPNRLAKGTAIEANLDKARGPVATFLVQNGTLKVGDVVVAGSAYGKVRAMVDDRGNRVEEAGPSFAVEVLGLRDVPKAGDEFNVFEEEKEASAIAGGRVQKARETRLIQGRYSLSALSARAQEGDLKELNLILKTDVQGSLEAILGSLRQLPQKEVQLGLLLAAPGEISETDIDLAAASGAVIIAFNTTMVTGARQAADLAGVDVREYSIIYKLLDDIEGAMEGLLDPELVEEALGQAQVRAVFDISRGAVAGCYVLSGKMIRNCKVRVRRKNEVIHEGILDSLKRIKDDVKEVNSGYECGIALSSFSNWAEEDIIEAYRMVTKRRKLSS